MYTWWLIYNTVDHHNSNLLVELTTTMANSNGEKINPTNASKEFVGFHLSCRDFCRRLVYLGLPGIAK